jgi:hypothetical protein
MPVTLATGKVNIGRWLTKVSPGQKVRPHLKNNIKQKQLEMWLKLGKHSTLSTNPTKVGEKISYYCY